MYEQQDFWPIRFHCEWGYIVWGDSNKNHGRNKCHVTNLQRQVIGLSRLKVQEKMTTNLNILINEISLWAELRCVI